MTNRFPCLLFLAGLAAAAAPAGATAPPAPEYAVRRFVAAVVRVWGNDQMQALVQRWETGFERRQPAVRFENRLLGTGTAMAGLYTGVADVAFLGRDATPKELQAFQWVRRYPPERIDVVTGSRDEAGRSPALVVYVPRANPLAQLTLAQLAAIVGCAPEAGRSPVTRWGQLGLSGPWADRPIRVYTFATDTGTGTFLQHVLLHDSRKWAWDRVAEFRDRVGADGTEQPAGRQIAAALAGDPGGLGIAGRGDALPAIHPVVLGVGERGPFYDAGAANLTAGTYPLARVLPAYVNREPGRPLDPAVRAFLEYILSRQGQDDVIQDGAFLPLSPAAAAAARARLE